MSLATAAAVTKASILVVEDDTVVAHDLCRRLERLEYRILDVCSSVEEAARVAEHERPDLLLMEVRLNGVDVVDAAIEIRRSVDLPLLFLTSHSDRATLNRVKQSNPDGFVLKPVEQRDLMVAIEFALHRHHVIRQLRTSERRYAATLASVADAVLATDRDGRVTFMNPVAQSLTGRTFEDACRRPIQEIIPLRDEVTNIPLTAPVSDALIKRTIVRGLAPAMLVCLDGSLVPVDYNVSPIVDENAGVTGAVMAFRDLRQQREVEAVLKRVDDEKSHSQRLETIGRLAAGVAHDFNNVLTVIGGDAEMALTYEAVQEDVKGGLRNIVDAVARGAALARQLLVFSRKQQTEVRVVDVNEFIYGIRHMLTRLLGGTITLDITNDGSPAQISIDLSQLEVILLNLAANARDAMALRGGVVSIRVEQTDTLERPDRPSLKAGRYVKVSVTDQGEGIDPTVIAKIFEPFFTTKAVGRGTGLGLATVHSVVKRFGGHIYVDSAPDLGTTFSIYFRPADSKPVVVDLPQRNERTGTETILLVEDDENVRHVAGAALRKRGYRVLESATPSEARRIAMEHAEQIHLVVSDVALPEMDGCQLTEALRGTRPDIKVLFMSGSPEEVLRMHDLELEDVLSKPFTPTSLANRVWSTLHDSTPLATGAAIAAQRPSRSRRRAYR